MISRGVSRTLAKTMTGIRNTASGALTDLDKDLRAEGSVQALFIMFDAVSTAAMALYPNTGVDASIRKLGFDSSSTELWSVYQEADGLIKRLRSIHGPHAG